MSAADADTAGAPTLRRALGRWQILALSINDVVGSGVYLLPAATVALLGDASVWAVLAAGLAVALLVLCYAQAASCFDQPGGSYLYVREAFGRFLGFEVGWMTWLTRIAVAAALSNGLALAIAAFWPAAATGVWRGAIIVGSLGLLTVINLVGVRSAAHAGVALVAGKLLPLLLLLAIGVFHVDWSRALVFGAPPLHDPARLGEGALLLLFAYAGFENIPAAAGEFRRPRRDVPFALLTMIALCTALYVAVQVVVQGLLPDVAASAAPLADTARLLGGSGFALLLTVGAVISILGTNHNTMLIGPRYLYALAHDGFGPRALGRVHPRFRTPHVAIGLQTTLALALAFSGSFEQLALLSAVARLCSYSGTAAAVMVLRRRFRDRDGLLHLPGGDLIPLLALGVCVALMASAQRANLIAAAIALAIGALVYALHRRPPP